MIHVFCVHTQHTYLSPPLDFRPHLIHVNKKKDLLLELNKGSHINETKSCLTLTDSKILPGGFAFLLSRLAMLRALVVPFLELHGFVTSMHVLRIRILVLNVGSLRVPIFFLFGKDPSMIDK